MARTSNMVILVSINRHTPAYICKKPDIDIFDGLRKLKFTPHHRYQHSHV